MSGESHWGKKSFVLVTGSSRGLGRTISIEFAKNVAPGSVFLLVARSGDALEKVKAEVLAAAPEVEVQTAALDLGKPDGPAWLDVIQKTVAGRDFDAAILVHNAGSLGNLSLKVSQYDDLKEIQDYYAFNLFHMIILNTQFLKVFNNPEKLRSVVQITSLGAVQPFKTWGYYCAGKAARDMLMQSLALEDPSIRTINYSPGSFYSAIFDEAASQTGDDETRNLFIVSDAEGKVLSPEQTTRKLVRCLGTGKYVKGEHVDFYDLPDEDA